MVKDPLAQNLDVHTATVNEGFVEVTIKGGAYAAVTLTSRRPTLDEVRKDLADAITDIAKAQVSLDRAVELAQAEGKAPAPGQYGRPAAADKSSDTALPFADSTEPSDPSKCVHGDRTLFEGGGKKGWVCSRPKGSDDRCETIFV